MKHMNKRINQLVAGDVVISITNIDETTTIFQQPYMVTSITEVTLKGKTFPVFIKLEGGRFWPTGKDDPRTCEITK